MNDPVLTRMGIAAYRSLRNVTIDLGPSDVLIAAKCPRLGAGVAELEALGAPQT